MIYTYTLFNRFFVVFFYFSGSAAIFFIKFWSIKCWNLVVINSLRQTEDCVNANMINCTLSFCLLYCKTE